MKDFNLSKIFQKKENISLLKSIDIITGKPIAVVDEDGKLIFGRKTRDAVFSAQIKEGVDIHGMVFCSDKAEADGAASLISNFISAWSVQKSLASEILKKYKEHDILYNINDRTSLCPKTDEIAIFIIKEVGKIVKFEMAAIGLIEPSSQNIKALASYGNETDDYSCVERIDRVNSGVLKNGKGEIFNHMSGEKNCCVISVPLKTREKVIGLFYICSFGTSEPYNSSDYKILSTVASYAANSIEITRLYNAEKERADKLLKKNIELNEAKDLITSENTTLKQGLRQKFSSRKIVGVSGPVKNMLEKIDKISNISSNVLITGESGTGKELVAKAIHYSSIRAEKPFIAINCSAIPGALFESELFGIEKGVATGVEKRRGKIAEADGGTLFLDEIGDMPMPEQAKLLRVLQDMEVVPVGGSKPVKFDVRIIAATNKGLSNEIEKGGFRRDLFYRLNVINLDVPPLRERMGDIPVLVNYFMKNTAAKFDRNNIRFSKEAFEAMEAYDWPGNIRELENEVERAVALCFSEEVRLEDLSESVRKFAFAAHSENIGTGGDEDNLEENEKFVVKRALFKSNGNQTAAAKALGISREGLRKKMKRLGL